MDFHIIEVLIFSFQSRFSHMHPAQTDREALTRSPQIKLLSTFPLGFL